MKIIIAALLFCPVFGLAQDAENFDEGKKKVLEMIDKRIADMNTHRTCVNAATTKEAIKECQKKMHEVRMDNKMDRRERKKDRR